MAVGTIPAEAANFWRSQPSADLTEYVFTDASERLDVAQLEGVDILQWDEIGDVIFAQGPFVEQTSIEVTDNNRDFIVGVGIEGIRDAGLIGNDDTLYTEKRVSDKPLLFSCAFEELTVWYQLSLKQPFDINMLKLNVITIDDDYEIIRSFDYDGQPLSPDDVQNGPLFDKESRLIYER